jgi:hypothetical protein
LVDFAAPFSSCSKMSDSWSPRKTTEWPAALRSQPSRWSLPALAIDARQHALPIVHRLQHRGAEDEELHVVVRRVAGAEQVVAELVGQRPVVVLARAVDAGKRLLVQQAGQARTSAPPSAASSIVINWWSTARLAFSNTGAISYWLGATSL